MRYPEVYDAKWKPLEVGSKVRIPCAHSLPEAFWRGQVTQITEPDLNYSPHVFVKFTDGSEDSYATSFQITGEHICEDVEVL